jgi:hypothetical protein
MIEFSGTCSKEDVVKAARLHLTPSRGWRIGLGVVSVVPILLAVLLKGSLLYGLVPVAMYGVLVLVVWLAARSSARRSYETNAMMQEPVWGTVPSDGVTIASSVGEARVPWDAFYQRKIGADIVLLFQSAAVFHVFPRRFFPSDEGWREFRQLAAENVKKRAADASHRVMRLLALWVVVFVLVILLWTFLR